MKMTGNIGLLVLKKITLWQPKYLHHAVVFAGPSCLPSRPSRASAESCKAGPQIRSIYRHAGCTQEQNQETSPPSPVNRGLARLPLSAVSAAPVIPSLFFSLSLSLRAVSRTCTRPLSFVLASSCVALRHRRRLRLDPPPSPRSRHRGSTSASPPSREFLGPGPG